MIGITMMRFSYLSKNQAYSSNLVLQKSFMSSADKDTRINKACNYILLILTYLGLMIFVPVISNGAILVPAITYTFPAFLLLVWKVKKITGSVFLPVLLLTILALVSIVATTASMAAYWDKMRGLLFFIYGLSGALGLYLGIVSSTPKAISNLTLGLMVFIIIGASLESFFGVSAISDSFREKFMLTPYFADQRDIEFIGRIRPKLFTSEPSYLAGFFALMSFQWLVLSDGAAKGLKFFSLTAVSGYVIGSPMVVVAVIGGFAIEFYKNSRKRNKSTKSKKLMLTVFGVIAILLLSTTILQNRIQETLDGKEGSFVIRIVTPFYMALLAIEQNALFGVGLSGAEEAMDSVIVEGATLSNIPGMTGDAIDRNQSTFFSLWMYFGLLGGCFFLILLSKLLQNINIDNKRIAWAMLLVFSQMGLGSIHGLKFWAYSMSFLACLNLLDGVRKQRKDDLSKAIPRGNVIDG